MTVDPEYVFQLVMGILLAVIGLMVNQALDRLKALERSNERNTARLIRIETKMGITDGNHDIA